MQHRIAGDGRRAHAADEGIGRQLQRRGRLVLDALADREHIAAGRRLVLGDRGVDRDGAVEDEALAVVPIKFERLVGRQRIGGFRRPLRVVAGDLHRGTGLRLPAEAGEIGAFVLDDVVVVGGADRRAERREQHDIGRIGRQRLLVALEGEVIDARAGQADRADEARRVDADARSARHRFRAAGELPRRTGAALQGGIRPAFGGGRRLGLLGDLLLGSMLLGFQLLAMLHRRTDEVLPRSNDHQRQDDRQHDVLGVFFLHRAASSAERLVRRGLERSACTRPNAVSSSFTIVAKDASRAGRRPMIT